MQNAQEVCQKEVPDNIRDIIVGGPGYMSAEKKDMGERKPENVVKPSDDDTDNESQYEEQLNIIEKYRKKYRKEIERYNKIAIEIAKRKRVYDEANDQENIVMSDKNLSKEDKEEFQKMHETRDKIDEFAKSLKEKQKASSINDVTPEQIEEFMENMQNEHHISDINDKVISNEMCKDDCKCKQISARLYKELERLGIIDNSGVRNDNAGTSNYSKHFIQPWTIWIDYPELNSWDHDIVKRVLRQKVDAGYSAAEQRKLDYKKIIHDCEECIRQIEVTEKQEDK